MILSRLNTTVEECVALCYDRLNPYRFDTRHQTSAESAFRPSFFAAIVVLFIFEGKEVRNLASVVLRSNESQDQLLKRFRKKVIKSGVLSTVRRKRWFVSKSELRRMERKKSIRRMKRRQSKDTE
jgi:small subunit ribosomal protein S21